jgi:hypothetical protein
MHVNERRLGWLTLAAAAGLVFAIQVAHPVGVPLYDGVPVQEPYRFLHPSGDQLGSPGSFSDEFVVAGATSPTISAFTTENPPQAQLIGQKGAFTLTAGATKLLVSITPVDAPPTAPDGGRIAGNVYRFTVTDQAGSPVSIASCSACLTLRLRAPDDVGDAVLKRYADGAWLDVNTIHEGVGGTYVTNVLALGDYAVVDVTQAEPQGLSPIVVIGGAAVVVLLAIGAFLLFRVRQAPPAPEPVRRTRIPSKKKGRR